MCIALRVTLRTAPGDVRRMRVVVTGIVLGLMMSCGDMTIETSLLGGSLILWLLVIEVSRAPAPWMQLTSSTFLAPRLSPVLMETYRGLYTYIVLVWFRLGGPTDLVLRNLLRVMSVRLHPGVFRRPRLVSTAVDRWLIPVEESSPFRRSLTTWLMFLLLIGLELSVLSGSGRILPS